MTGPAPVSDEALFERFQGGDLSAFDELYARYEGPVFGFVLRFLGERAEAEDVLHETFLGVLRGRREQGSFRAWLFQVARHLCLNRRRSQRREARALKTASHEEAAPPAAQAALERHQAVQALHAAVQGLPELLAEVYHLRVAGLSYEEMAEVVGAPLGTVKSRMHEMLERLRAEMKPWTAS